MFLHIHHLLKNSLCFVHNGCQFDTTTNVEHICRTYNATRFNAILIVSTGASAEVHHVVSCCSSITCRSPLFAQQLSRWIVPYIHTIYEWAFYQFSWHRFPSSSSTSRSCFLLLVNLPFFNDSLYRYKNYVIFDSFLTSADCSRGATFQPALIESTQCTKAIWIDGWPTWQEIERVQTANVVGRWCFFFRN